MNRYSSLAYHLENREIPEWFLDMEKTEKWLWFLQFNSRFSACTEHASSGTRTCGTLKRPSCDQDTGAAQSLAGIDFDVEGMVGTAGGKFWLLATDLVSFSSSLYSIFKKGYHSHGNWNFISNTTQLLYQETENQIAGTM
jgi:hypothetical protein